MPTYEMPLLLRIMSRADTATTLKRIASVIFHNGGFIRKIDNLGQQRMPYKTKSHGNVHYEASYFILHFVAPPSKLDEMQEEYRRDMDIIRNRLYKTEPVPNKQCTLHEETLPPAYRPSVQKLVELAERQSQNKYKFKSNSGLDYYPFQR